MGSKPSHTYLIIGAGVSGLCLAYFLSHSLSPDQNILIIDRDTDPDYNISFWADSDTPFAPIMKKTWRKIAVRYANDERICPLNNYYLQAFWRADFDSFVLEALYCNPQISFLDAHVTQITDNHDHAEVITDKDTFHAAWVFDSRLNVSAIQHDDPSTLLMQGLAWEIRTEQPLFDPEVATLFDFLVDTPQFDFIYILPYSPTFALVDFAYVSTFASAENRAFCEETLRKYIMARLGVMDYTVEKAAYGRIPLSANPIKRHTNSRIVPIGVRGGMVKASTSYAFTRILADSQQIVTAVTQTGKPYYQEHRAWYYRWADKNVMNVFLKMPRLAQEIMFNMFSVETGDAALRFLDEKNSLIENQKLFETIPPEVLRRFLIGMVLPRAEQPHVVSET
jgi:lycopene beta-cyclase